MTIIERERQADVQVDERERRASVLEAAALEIEYRGWCQGVYVTDHGALCMESAIIASGGSRVNELFYGRDVYDVVYVPDLFEWNDIRPDRTAAEVCFVLRWRAQEIRDGR